MERVHNSVPQLLILNAPFQNLLEKPRWKRFSPSCHGPDMRPGFHFLSTWNDEGEGDLGVSGEDPLADALSRYPSATVRLLAKTILGTELSPDSWSGCIPSPTPPSPSPNGDPVIRALLSDQALQPSQPEQPHPGVRRTTGRTPT